MGRLRDRLRRRYWVKNSMHFEGPARVKYFGITSYIDNVEKMVLDFRVRDDKMMCDVSFTQVHDGSEVSKKRNKSIEEIIDGEKKGNTYRISGIVDVINSRPWLKGLIGPKSFGCIYKGYIIDSEGGKYKFIYNAGDASRHDILEIVK